MLHLHLPNQQQVHPPQHRQQQQLKLQPQHNILLHLPHQAQQHIRGVQPLYHRAAMDQFQVQDAGALVRLVLIIIVDIAAAMFILLQLRADQAAQQLTQVQPIQEDIVATDRYHQADANVVQQIIIMVTAAAEFIKQHIAQEQLDQLTQAQQEHALKDILIIVTANQHARAQEMFGAHHNRVALVILVHVAAQAQHTTQAQPMQADFVVMDPSLQMDAVAAEQLILPDTVAPMFTKQHTALILEHNLNNVLQELRGIVIIRMTAKELE